MGKEIHIDMIVECDIPLNDFNDKFVDWIESNNWFCGGHMSYCEDKIKQEEQLKIYDSSGKVKYL